MECPILVRVARQDARVALGLPIAAPKGEVSKNIRKTRWFGLDFLSVSESRLGLISDMSEMLRTSTFFGFPGAPTQPTSEAIPGNDRDMISKPF